MNSNMLILLDTIEKQEMLSIAWGYVDGSLSRKDVINLAKNFTADTDNAEDLLEELIEHCLVFEVKGDRIRSRFAEIIRLLSRLRQLFPGKPWQSAPRLVSDFRVDRRFRFYPNRNLPASELAKKHAQILSETPLRSALWSALTNNPMFNLAAFQERAILRLLTVKPDTGTIVTAGTGSGKTLAFYLPALLQIGDQIQSNQYWVKALAIYPRTELLKDQLAETFRSARKLDSVLIKNNKRPLILGAYFSSTPNNSTAKDIAAKWKKHGEAYICPWFDCPTCGGNLIWIGVDITANKERLICKNNQCTFTIGDEQLVLTRQRLKAHPPDILFTTTEMLNQRMSDIEMRKLFGIGQASDRKPKLVLLDEVHTYVGTSGAQVALVLRRWRHLLAEPVTWCGLSATLREANQFFSDLTGVAPDKIAEITPTSEEMICEGAEYQVVLRGDTTLQAPLLSTSIQAAMLIGRMMDPTLKAPSNGIFGKRLFVFTDDLDVTNRIFDYLKDAEAYNIFGKPDGTRNPLATMRGKEPEDSKRDTEGQRWRVCESIGRKLEDRLIVGRTAAKDPGVLAGADVIVATAALEVGYNDDEVGAVIQHKSPRNMASFLQRKGRAGRVRIMRPLMVTVLSDYGRDRVSFQAYEHLFDPALPPQHLPIHNQYVLRMQAVFAFIDWLAVDAANFNQSGWLWDFLSKPNTSSSQQTLVQVKKRLTLLGRCDLSIIASLKEHLRQALGIDTEIVDSLLWEPPRAILLEVIPTLIRKLFFDWKLAFPSQGVYLDFQVDFHPLPDFIPRTLFSDLSLPEVQVILPPATINDESKQEALPIVQALKELAPGRVTRRFAFERGELCHWVEIDVDAREQSLSIEKYAEYHESLGLFEGYRGDGEKCILSVYRPWSIRLTQAKSNIVLPTSNAFPIWFSGFILRGTPLVIDTPPKSSWFDHVSYIHFYLHRFRAGIAVRRFSPEVHALVKKKSGETLSTIRYIDANAQPAAVGFEIEVDGFYVDFNLPSAEDLFSLALPDDLSASSRLAYHRFRLLNDSAIPQEINVLQREWLHQVLVSAAMERAISDHISVGEAAIKLLSESPEKVFADVMKSLVALQDAEEYELSEEEEDSDGNGSSGTSRLEDRLAESIGNKEVIDQLKALAPELDNPDPIAYGTWLRNTLYGTLAEALLQACINTAPRHAAIDTLVSDLEIIAETGCGRVWITETTLGGGGVVQAFADVFSSEPRALFRALEAALAPTDLELSSYGLKRFLTLACEDPNIAKLTAELRAVEDHAARNDLREQLYMALGQGGVEMSHALSVSMNTRMFRVGTSQDSDKLLFKLVNEWEKLESRFSLSIGLREFCYLALKLPDIRTDLISFLGKNALNEGDAELIQVLSGLLWPRGIEIRQRSLQSYNPFQSSRITDPALVRTLLLRTNVAVVPITQPEWPVQVAKFLSDNGIVQVLANRNNEGSLRSVIINVVGRPVNVGYLQFFPVVERIERGEIDTRVTLSLREQV